MIGDFFCEKHSEKKPGYLICGHVLDDGESISHYATIGSSGMHVAVCAVCNMIAKDRLLNAEELKNFYVFCPQCGKEALHGIPRPA